MVHAGGRPGGGSWPGLHQRHRLEDFIEQLQRPMQLDLDPARRFLDGRARVVRPPALHKAHLQHAESSQVVHANAGRRRQTWQHHTDSQTFCIQTCDSRLPLSFIPLLVHWRCWLGDRKGIRPVKNWVVGCWRGYLSGARCRLAWYQLMPLPLTVSCFSKIQIGFTFLVLAHPGSPRQRAVKRVCVVSEKKRSRWDKCCRYCMGHQMSNAQATMDKKPVGNYRNCTIPVPWQAVQYAWVCFSLTGQ